MKSVDIEIILNSWRTTKKAIISIVKSYLGANRICPNSTISDFDKTRDAILYDDVKAIILGEIENYKEAYLDLSDISINWFVYTLDYCGSITQKETGDGDEHLITSTHMILPAYELYNSWENLFYEANVKENLLKYAQTMMEFSDRGVDSNIVTCNRVILLHGPPGTGKTSLCKALAHKLSIRMCERFSSGLLIEINSHSLFSKWFSESGKLVSKLFAQIGEIVENKQIFVCLLIDEIESIARARNQCLTGIEPTDSIRVVNAVLTQIDQIKRHSNVLILTTSNITESIDLAFVDRADIKQYLGLPTVPAIYQIYYTCINELMKTKIIEFCAIPEPNWIVNDNGQRHTQKLLDLCEKSVGLSGRTLRKVPFIAHALYLSNRNEPNVKLDAFLEAMDKAVDREKFEREYFICNKTNKE